MAQSWPWGNQTADKKEEEEVLSKEKETCSKKDCFKTGFWTFYLNYVISFTPKLVWHWNTYGPLKFDEQHMSRKNLALKYGLKYDFDF